MMLPPKDNGIVDLNQYKGPTRAQLEVIKQHRVQVLRKNNLSCPCGELIALSGVKLYLINEGMIQNQQTGMIEPGVQLMGASFHSRDCPALMQILNRPIKDGEPRPLCIEEIPPIEWMPEPATMGT